MIVSLNFDHVPETETTFTIWTGCKRHSTDIQKNYNVTEVFLMDSKMDDIIKGPQQASFDFICYSKSEVLVLVYYLLNNFLITLRKGGEESRIHRKESNYPLQTKIQIECGSRSKGCYLKNLPLLQFIIRNSLSGTLHSRCIHAHSMNLTMVSCLCHCYCSPFLMNLVTPMNIVAKVLGIEFTY